MQHPDGTKKSRFLIARAYGSHYGLLGCRAALLILLLVGLTGCGGSPGIPSPGQQESRQFEGVTLTVSCPDSRLASLLTPMAAIWGERSGANVKLITEPMSPGASSDIGIVSSADLGAWAERGELLPVPGTVKVPGHPYQWSAVFPAYRGEPYAGWGSQLYGLPLAAPGTLLVYRSDRFSEQQAKEAFQSKYGRPLTVPTTWEDFADVASFFSARDQMPSLAPLPSDPKRLVDLFSTIASSFDRPALSEAGPGAAAPVEAERLSFQFRLDDGRPRIDAPAFVRAAELLAELKSRGSLPQKGDAVTALTAGEAVMGILWLNELAELREGRTKVQSFAIAPLPATEFHFDKQTGSPVPSPGNYVPHYGGAWFGVVRTSCKHPAAAWDLLAELGGPERSLEIIAAGGYGPTRDTHLDRDRLLAWYGYGFGEEQSRSLQDSLRANAGKAVRNPTFTIRGPDHEALTSALADKLKEVIAGSRPAREGMSEVAAEWERSTTVTPNDRINWRRRAVGLN